MSPTSYQAAPPRATSILSKWPGSVKFRGKSSLAPNCRFGEICGYLAALPTYQELYGVPSNGETNPEAECTSVMPVPVWSGLNCTSSNTVCQSVLLVQGSLGTLRKYCAATRSSSELGAASLSSVYWSMAWRSTNRSCFSAASLLRTIERS